MRTVRAFLKFITTLSIRQRISKLNLCQDETQTVTDYSVIAKKKKNDMALFHQNTNENQGMPIYWDLLSKRSSMSSTWPVNSHRVRTSPSKLPNISIVKIIWRLLLHNCYNGRTTSGLAWGQEISAGILDWLFRTHSACTSNEADTHAYTHMGGASQFSRQPGRTNISIARTSPQRSLRQPNV